jgi:hypothetical protein
MSRNRTGTQVAADTAGHKGSAVLLELLFDSGTLRLCIGPWSITSGGNLYVHTGAAMQVEAHGEAADGTEGLQFTLSGLEAGIFDLLVNEPYQRRLVRLLEQRFNAADAAADVASVEYIGRMLALQSSEDMAARSWTVTLQTEVFDAEGRRARNLRFSDAEQRRRYPADLGAEYVASMVERVMTRAPI